MIQRTWTIRQKSYQEAMRQGGRLPPQARPPPSWAPCCSTDVLLPPIYTYVPPNYQIRSQKPNSTATTFCTREIPSWGLFRRSAGGASITEGFYINTIASPMKCEQFTSDLRLHSYQLDGFLFNFLTQGPSPLDHVRSENHVPEGFIPFGLRLIFFFCETLKQAINSNSGLGLRLIGQSQK